MAVEQTPQYPFPKRRELREASEEKRNKKRRVGLPEIARGGLLAVLAAATVAVPVSGFVGPENTLAIPAKAVTIATTEQSWAQAENTEVGEAVALREVASAASRAKLRTPLEVSQCMKSMPANGNREVSESAPIVWPMMEGSFVFASPFGMRFHPVLGYMRMHEGVDLAGQLGTPVFAVSDGVVEESHPAPGVGYWLKIKHQLPSGEVYHTAYAHMYASDVRVSEGDKVVAGQQVGAVGNTGTSTGPHLHFEVHDSTDTPIDPMTWLKAHDARQPGEGCE